MSTAKYPAFGQRRARRRPRVSLTVERLEDRTTPAVFVVNTLMDTTDASPGDGVAKDASGQTSLRAAIMEANANTGAADITIQLPVGHYKLSIPNANGQENDALEGDLDVTSPAHKLIIQGGGSPNLSNPGGQVIIDAVQLDRVFHIVNPGIEVEFKNLTIQGGLARDDGTAGALPKSPLTAEALGGGILADLRDGGMITLE